MPHLSILPALDSIELAGARRQELDLSLPVVIELGRSALAAIESGYYSRTNGAEVDWSAAVAASVAAKESITPDDPLPHTGARPFEVTRTQVSNETTMAAAYRLTMHGYRPLALNFADGERPGGGFLTGSRAQEEVLCRSSALYATLHGDPMYTAHRLHTHHESTDWAIHSPDVPVFRKDDGTALDEPWLCSFITCAAPYAPTVGLTQSAALLRQRINRVLAIAEGRGYTALVLGAWGCGAFQNDPLQTAKDFRHSLGTTFAGAFEEVVFAITDWSPERRFLGPFAEVFR